MAGIVVGDRALDAPGRCWETSLRENGRHIASTRGDLGAGGIVEHLPVRLQHCSAASRGRHNCVDSHGSQELRGPTGQVYGLAAASKMEQEGSTASRLGWSVHPEASVGEEAGCE